MQTSRYRLQLAAMIVATLAASTLACAEGGAATGPGTPSTPPAGAPPGPPAVAPGGSQTAHRVPGRVTDTQGRPLAGIKVVIDNTVFLNSAVTTQTDADGNYAAQVPAGSWRALARLERSYNGRTYTFDLHPDDATSF